MLDKNEKSLTEQEAPEKNTDHAFVQVGHDGKPVVPVADSKGKEKEDMPAEGSLQNR